MTTIMTIAKITIDNNNTDNNTNIDNQNNIWKNKQTAT